MHIRTVVAAVVAVAAVAVVSLRGPIHEALNTSSQSVRAEERAQRAEQALREAEEAERERAEHERRQREAAARRLAEQVGPEEAERLRAEVRTLLAAEQACTVTGTVPARIRRVSGGRRRARSRTP